MNILEMSERCRNLKSPIRDLVTVGKELEKKGKKIYWFNIGDPNKFDFDTPEHLKSTLKKVVDGKAGFYSDSDGDGELIDAIVKKENDVNSVNINREDVIVTNGISEGIQLMLNALIHPGKGDEILMPGPAYPVYPEITKFSGGIPITYKLDEENNWQVDIDDLRSKITDRTKIIVIISPNNPTGSVLSEKTLKEIINIAGEFDIPIASDEIYDRLVFGETKFHSTASLSNDVPVIGLNGFSKVYLVPGWRCGYIYFHDLEGKLNDIKEGIRAQARQRLSACTPIMKACAKAFENDSHIPELVRKLKERAEFAYRKLNSIEGISTVKPEGAFYIFPKIELNERWKNDEEFSYDVLKSIGLALPYGSGFDPTFGKYHFRSVILPPIEVMDEAFSMLKEFMEKR
jgi:aspartate/methionine/tyrosine aminotransferase